MNEIIVKDDIKIENMIYEIRGKQVMLDSDLAKLYQVETKRINEAVKNNIEKFPERFCFRITENEFNILKSKFSTSKGRGGSRKGHSVFTEQGIAMLATILKSKVATRVSIAIMDAFIVMRKFISSNLLEQKYVNNMVFELDERVSLLENTFSKFDTFSNEIFFEGQIYDAYSLLIDIFNTSKESIIIIDNYISKELLDILSKTERKVTIYTKVIDNNLINKYNSQYHNVKVLINNSFHDRFIIIDNKVLYHCGASFKDLGKKCFCISVIEDKQIIKDLIIRLGGIVDE